MEAALKTLLETTYTTARVQHRLGILQHVLEQVVYHTDREQSVEGQYQSVLTAYASEDDVTALTALGTGWVADINETTLAPTLKTAHSTVAALPTLTLYVPVTFDEAAERLLGAWCRSEVTPGVLLQLEVKPEVVGGCGFIVKDQYREHSLRTGLAEDPQVVTDVLASYA